MNTPTDERQMHWRNSEGAVTVGAFYAGRWIAYAEIVTPETSIVIQRRMTDGNTLETAQVVARQCGETILKAA